MALCPAEQCNAPAAFLAPTATCRTSTCEVRPPTEQFFFGETRDTTLRTKSTRCDVQNLGMMMMMMMSKIRESNLGAKKIDVGCTRTALFGEVMIDPGGFWGFILFETPPKYVWLHPTTSRYIPLHPVTSHYIPLHPITSCYIPFYGFGSKPCYRHSWVFHHPLGWTPGFFKHGNGKSMRNHRVSDLFFHQFIRFNLEAENHCKSSKSILFGSFGSHEMDPMKSPMVFVPSFQCQNVSQSRCCASPKHSAASPGLAPLQSPGLGACPGVRRVHGMFVASETKISTGLASPQSQAIEI